ncbi:acyl-CoA-binding protein [Cystobasidium minutum MCA 4210]|uniref:acyl-CoA-binding protein n=1 Tax=Cystobasidium minutum MCA 4210 TaxID=1397322 RepID=UPI0034CDAABC|eukprot:jgi/Rhomi1/112237/CE112236_8136
MSAQFDKAVSIVQSLPKDGPVKPSQAQQLEFYALYKQATLGDVTTSRPGIMDFTGRAKWDAYKKKEGMSQDDAKAAYATKLKEVLEASNSDEAKQYLKELEEAGAN